MSSQTFISVHVRKRQPVISNTDNFFCLNSNGRPFLQRGGGGGGGAMGFFTDNTRVRICFPVFNIRFYDKNSESDFFFFLHQNQNIFSATLGIRIFFRTYPLPPFQVKWSFPNVSNLYNNDVNLNNIYLENNQNIQYIKHSKYRQDSETSNYCFYKSVS